MVFSSVPLYLDPPTWNQQQLIHQQPGNTTTGGGGGSSSSDLQHHHQHQHQQQQLQPLPTQQLIQSAQPRTDGPAGQSQGQARPNSMADRARMAKIPQPEQALKCPRCDSTNTKFCYFNNYSLSQPRHFCKTCRRYWTRGGALRNVPVGGGCRRNKRSKSTSTSKSSSSAAADRQAGTTSSSSSAATTSASLTAPLPQMQFLASLHHPMIDYAPAGPNIELGFAGMQQQQQQQAVDYSQLGEQWRMNQIQQFPFLGGLEAPSHLQAPQIYPFDGAPSGSELITQLASVKMEDNPRGLNLARQYNLGMNLRSSGASDQFWAAGSSSGADQSGSGGGGGSTGGWMTNLSVFNSSSTGSLL